MSTGAASAQTNYGPSRIFYQSQVTPGNFSNTPDNKKLPQDANGDGISDLIVVGGTAIYVYIGNGAGDFTPVAVSAGAFPFYNRAPTSVLISTKTASLILPGTTAQTMTWSSPTGRATTPATCLYTACPPALTLPALPT